MNGLFNFVRLRTEQLCVLLNFSLQPRPVVFKFQVKTPGLSGLELLLSENSQPSLVECPFIQHCVLFLFIFVLFCLFALFLFPNLAKSGPESPDHIRIDLAQPVWNRGHIH